MRLANQQVLRRQVLYSLQRPSATGSGSCGAAEAVAARGDPASGKPGERIEVPNGPRLARFAHLDVEHLIEIAVVELPVPAHTDQRAAHELRHGGGIKVVHQQTNVRFVFAALD